MSDDVKVAVVGDACTLVAPYDPALPARARKIGGRFEPAPLKLWRFDARDETRVRALAIEIYGTDGSEVAGPAVTVRVSLTKAAPGFRDGANEYRLAGRRLAWRRGRDEAVQLADKVIVVEGEFESSGGSMRYPDLGDTSGVVLEVRDVPLSVAEKMQAEQADVTIVDESAPAQQSMISKDQTEITIFFVIDDDGVPYGNWCGNKADAVEQAKRRNGAEGGTRFTVSAWTYEYKGQQLAWAPEWADLPPPAKRVLGLAPEVE